jgi:hypothetical protein
MKQLKLVLLLISTAVLINCNNEEETSDLGDMVYQLQSVTNPAILGKVTMTKTANGSATMLVELNGASTDVHPVYIYYNSLEQGGPIAITLNPIDCDCEFSTTVVSMLDNGNAISYEDLLTFNGHIKVHKSSNELETVLLQGNIGSNKD